MKRLTGSGVEKVTESTPPIYILPEYGITSIVLASTPTHPAHFPSPICHQKENTP